MPNNSRQAGKQRVRDGNGGRPFCAFIIKVGGMAMHREALIHQLLSIRAGVDACLSFLSEQREQEETACHHPEDRRENLTVMGGPTRFRCKDCGEEIEGEL